MEALYDERPTSLLDCVHEKTLQLVPELLLAYHDRLDDDREREKLEEAERAASGSPERKKKKQRRSPTHSNFMKRNPETGALERYLPEDSTWYSLYVAASPQTDAQHKKFRRRFRMPYQSYLNLLEDARIGGWFPNVGKKDATGRAGAPLELLLLGALRYIGRGWTFDDLEEATGISEERHRRFLHDFIKVGSTTMYDRWVIMPTTADEAATHMAEYTKAGFPGCPFSSDGTHVMSEKIQARLRNVHLGPKEAHTARAFNTTVNHRRMILNTTRGAPSTFNDKILVNFDDLLCGIETGTLLSDVVFELYEYDNAGSVTTASYSGVYALVDCGYIQRASLVCPIKYPASVVELRWSRWLESMRKDVECTFGIMKGRFRILKCGIRLHGVEAVDDLWATCCALHNMLLEVDGLSDEWEKGVPSDWEGALGNHEAEDIPLIFRRVGGSAAADLSGMGSGGDAAGGTRRFGTGGGYGDGGGDDDDGGGSGGGGGGSGGAAGPTPVRSLNLRDFRQKLITHFDILWGRREVVWPSRNGVMD